MTCHQSTIIRENLRHVIARESWRLPGHAGWADLHEHVKLAFFVVMTDDKPDFSNVTADEMRKAADDIEAAARSLQICAAVCHGARAILSDATESHYAA